MACGLTNGCATSIITKGLGVPAKNNLVLGISQLQIKVGVTPTPSPTPTITPSPTTSGQIGRGGVYNVNYRQNSEHNDTERDIQIQVSWGDNKILKTFRIDSYWKNIIVERIGGINRIKQAFTAKIKNIKNRFNVKWKK